MVFRNTLLNGGSVVFTIALSFLLLPFAIDHLGVDAYGVWVLALSFSLSGGYLGLSDLGIQQGVVKFVAEAHGRGEPSAASPLVSTALAIFAAMALVAGLFISAAAAVAPEVLNVPPGFETALRLLLLVIGIEAVIGLPGLAFLAVLEGLQRYDAIRIVDFSRQVLYAVVVVAVLLNGGGVVAYGAAMSLSSAAGAIGYFVAARRLVPGLKVSTASISRSELRRLSSFSGWVLLSKVNGVLWRQMDKLILGAVLTTTVLTDYDVANKIQAAAAAMLSFTGWAVMPAASALFAGDERDRLRELLLRGTRYVLALSFPIIVGGIIMAEPLITHWVGSHFSDVAPATQLFLALQFLVCIAIVANNLLVGIGRVRMITVYASVAAATNLAVSLLLVRELELVGVIMGSLAGHLLVTPLYIRLSLHDLHVPFREFLRVSVLPLLPWAVAFGLCVELTRRAFPPTNIALVFVECLPGLLLYIGGIAFVAFSPEERQMLRGFVRPGAA